MGPRTYYNTGATRAHRRGPRSKGSENHSYEDQWNVAVWITVRIKLLANKSQPGQITVS